jgi:hypothetical protein
MVRRAGKPRLPDRQEYDPEPGSPGLAEVAWEDVERRLASDLDYWLITTRDDGRPHAIAIWAVWLHDALWFTTAPGTASARNLARDPRALVHLESGRQPVLLEGSVERPVPDQVPPSVIDAYEAKYGWRMDPRDAGMPFLVLRPNVARAWRAEDVRGSVVRWEFDA